MSDIHSKIKARAANLFDQAQSTKHPAFPRSMSEATQAERDAATMQARSELIEQAKRSGDHDTLRELHLQSMRASGAASPSWPRLEVEGLPALAMDLQARLGGLIEQVTAAANGLAAAFGPFIEQAALLADAANRYASLGEDHDVDGDTVEELRAETEMRADTVRALIRSEELPPS
jgi:phage tail protein X